MRRLFWLALICACSKESAWHAGQPLTLDVTSAFPAGTAVRDQSSGATAIVAANGSVSITPDTSYFFSSDSSQEALNTLLVAARTGEGFIKITGEVGTGKTLLCRKFLGTLDDSRWVSAYIPNPSLEPRTLLIALAEELGATVEPGVDQA